MGKTYIDTIKYMIHARFVVEGLVEKPDVVGAIFGQTEGLLGSELDLRELQKSGRIGRIEVELSTQGNKTVGTIRVPSSLDMVETSIIAAALEVVDRIGPCEGRIKVEKIEDTRLEKRKYVIEKAKSLLKEMINNVIPESKEISQLVRDEVKAMGVIEYGEDKLVAGVGVPSSDSIILVEGRADVINLLKHNINNALAIGGAKIPKSLVKISKEKEVTLFIDGDRGGEIILQQLVQAGVDIDYVARAPAGKEVEELTRKEIIKALRNKVPFVKKEERSVKRTDSGSVEEALKERLKSVKNTYKALYLDENLNVVGESAVRDLIRRLKDSEGVSYVVFDGIITQRIVDLAKERNLRGVAGLKMGHVNKRNVDITLVVE